GVAAVRRADRHRRDAGGQVGDSRDGHVQADRREPAARVERAARPRSGGLPTREDRGVGRLHCRKDPPVRGAGGARRQVRRRSAAGELVLGHRLLRADDAPLQRAAIVLSALPHGVSGRYVHAARAAGKRAVDLSADFRLSPEAVYGLTEVTRPRVAAAELVANPGCYPTAALLALLPLARQGL